MKKLIFTAALIAAVLTAAFSARAQVVPLGPRFVLPFQTVVDSNGVPIPGAMLYFYASGTNSPHNTYADPLLTTPNANPVVANSAGVFPTIFLNGNYKVVLTDSFGNQIWTADPLFGEFITGSGATPAAIYGGLFGDCTATAVGLITCTKTAGTLFGTMATQNANAVDITGATLITGLPNPVNALDAATKQYVDSTASGLVVHQAVALATAAALAANTYNNGTAGVGATLTGNANGALTVDGSVVTGAQRILVKNESTTSNNGIYVVTTVGSGGSPYVLTRSSDANTIGTGSPMQIGSGTFVLVIGGTANASSGWVINTALSAIGPGNPIVWAQFSSSSAVLSINGLTGSLAVTNGGGVIITPSGTNVAVQVPVSPPQGRITLQSGTPVMTTTQSAKATLYYDCFHGGKFVPYYNGTTDVPDTISGCEVSSAMASSGAGVLNNAGVFDVWWEGNTNHNICVATNGSGGGWASDTGGSNTVRGSGYSQLDTTTRPYITNASSVTHCYNGTTDYGAIAANKLTYLGTIYTTAAGQTTYQFGSAASGGGAAIIGLWNTYNRVDFGTNVTDSGALYTYTSATVRLARASSGNQITLVRGLNEDALEANYNNTDETVPVVGANVLNGLGFDSTTSMSCNKAAVSASSAGGGTVGTTAISCTWLPGVGLHILSALERGDSSNANVFNFLSSGTLSAKVRY